MPTSRPDGLSTLLARALRHDTDSTVCAWCLAAGFRKLDQLTDALTETARNDPAELCASGAALLVAQPRASSTRPATGGAAARR